MARKKDTIIFFQKDHCIFLRNPIRPINFLPFQKIHWSFGNKINFEPMKAFLIRVADKKQSSRLCSNIQNIIHVHSLHPTLSNLTLHSWHLLTFVSLDHLLTTIDKEPLRRKHSPSILQHTQGNEKTQEKKMTSTFFAKQIAFYSTFLGDKTKHFFSNERKVSNSQNMLEDKNNDSCR